MISSDTPKVSIVIPVKQINDYIRESVPRILSMDYPNFEILIFPDSESGEAFKRCKIIPTGPVGPAEKRDLALKYAEGEILAFLDDDAYPRSDWLTKAVRHFSNLQVAAVGGPAVTPPHDSIWQKASGAVFESKLGGGKFTYRYLPGRMQEVDDFPSVNLLVRKTDFEKVGGFDSHYWPGEDTKLCHDLVYNLGKKIIYDPDVLVWHHRRNLFRQHFKQIKNYALHRGFFAKRLPKTSLKPAYLIPSLFVLGLIFGPLLCYFYPFLWSFFILTVAVYLGAVTLSVIRLKDLKLGVLTALGIIMTHIGYGTYFIKGLFKRELIQ
jgi:GT2 family glycosyltransferase